MKIRRVAVFASAGVGVFAIAAAAAFYVNSFKVVRSGMEGLRSVVYSSVEQLSNDSAIIVEVVVSDSPAEAIVDDSGRTQPPFVVSTVIVETLHGAPLAQELGAKQPAVGDELRIFQIGRPEALLGGVDVLEAGQKYLLFLVPTAIPGAAPNEYFPTGDVSGIYRVTDEGFTQRPVEGDTLPELVTSLELTQAVARAESKP